MTLGAYRQPGTHQWQDCRILGSSPDGRLICLEGRRDLAGVFLATRDQVRIVVGELHLKLLRRGWAGEASPAERAYQKAHAEWATAGAPTEAQLRVRAEFASLHAARPKAK